MFVFPLSTLSVTPLFFSTFTNSESLPLLVDYYINHIVITNSALLVVNHPHSWQWHELYYFIIIEIYNSS
jgi:hypothetical protein